MSLKDDRGVPLLRIFTQAKKCLVDTSYSDRSLVFIALVSWAFFGRFLAMSSRLAEIPGPHVSKSVVSFLGSNLVASAIPAIIVSCVWAFLTKLWARGEGTTIGFRDGLKIVAWSYIPVAWVTIGWVIAHIFLEPYWIQGELDTVRYGLLAVHLVAEVVGWIIFLQMVNTFGVSGSRSLASRVESR